MTKLSSIKQLDPVQGLVDYVLDVKPYHTKIIEVLIEYVFNEPVNVTILDDWQWNIEIMFPREEFSFVNCEGYSERPFGGTGLWPIISPNQAIPFHLYPAINVATNSFIVPGDRTDDFVPGTKLNIVTFVENYLLQGGSPSITAFDLPIVDVLSDCTIFPTPAGTGTFVVAGDRASLFPAGFTFYVFGTIINDKAYTVRSLGGSPAGAYYDVAQDVTFIPVEQAIISGTAGGHLGMVQTQGNNTGTFTVVSSIFNGGSIDSWPDSSDPLAYRVGDDPHTVVTVLEPLNNPLADPVYDGTVYTAYAAFVSIEKLLFEGVLSYSNFLRDYIPGSPTFFSQTPDEGLLTKPIVGVTLSTLDGFFLPIPDTGQFVIPGNLTRSNIFVGDKVLIRGSTGNNGLYTITSITYAGSPDETTIGVAELVDDTTIDGEAVIDVPSNVFIFDGDLTSRFVQGETFELVGGTLEGTYTTLNSDYVGNKTRVRTVEEILDVGSGFTIQQVELTPDGFVVKGNKTSVFSAGLQINVVGSQANDGSYIVGEGSPLVGSVYDGITDTTFIPVSSDSPLDTRPGGEIFPIVFGLIKEPVFGFGETSRLCELIPETVVYTLIDEQLTFSGEGITLSLHDDVLAYNLENNDTWGFMLPLSTIFAPLGSPPSPPAVPEQPGPPGGPDLNDLWFDTTTDLFRQWNGLLWKPIVTAYWLDTSTNLFYYRTKNQFVDTGWLQSFEKTPGYDMFQAAVGKTVFVGDEVFYSEDEGLLVPQVTFELQTQEVPHWVITGVDDTPGDSSLTVSGNVLGPDTSVGHKLTVISSPGGLNDGAYTVKDATFSAGETTIKLKEDLLDSSIGGNIIYDFSLFQVTVNSVPGAVTINSITSFTVISPEVHIGTAIRARIFEKTGPEYNGHVVPFSSEPHSVFHAQVDVDVDHNAYIVGGGNYINKFTPDTKFEGHQFGESPGLLGTWQATTLPIVDVDDVAGTITVNGDYTWLFETGIVFRVVLSENNSYDFVVQSSAYDSVSDTTVIGAILGSGSPPRSVFEVQSFYNPGIQTRNVDNVSDTIEVWGDQTFTFQNGLEVLLNTGISVVTTTHTGEFVIDGDETTMLVPGVRFRVFGSSFNNDHQVYTIVSAVAVGSPLQTIVTVAETVPDAIAGGDLFTLWTVDSSSYVDPIPPATAGNIDYLGYTIIQIQENIPAHVHIPTDTLHTPIFQNYSRDLGVILGAVYNPNVSPIPISSGSPPSIDICQVGGHDPSVEVVKEQVRTVVVVQTGTGSPLPNPVDGRVTGIGYTWIGPLRLEVGMKRGNTLMSAFDDTLGASDELIVAPYRYEIIDTDRTANTFRIHHDDPLTSLPVNLSGSFSPGTIFEVVGSYGEGAPSTLITNNSSYVVKSVTWEDPAGSPGGTGDTVIEVETDYDNVPPYNEFTVLSITNGTGSPADLPNQITLAGDHYRLFRSFAFGDHRGEQTGFTTNQVNGIIPISVPEFGSPPKPQMRYHPGAGDLIVYIHKTTGTFKRLESGTDYEEHSATTIKWIPPVGSPSASTPLGVNDTLIFFLSTPARVFRIDQPLVSTDPIYNTMTVVDIELVGGNTVLTIEETFRTDGSPASWIDYTGPLGIIDGRYRANILYDEVNGSVGSPVIPFMHGSILRESVRIEHYPTNVTNATFGENLDFGWGQTYTWEIIRTDAANSQIVIAGNFTGIIDSNDRGSISGSLGNDGEYEVAGVSFAAPGSPPAPETIITLKNPDLPVDPPGSPSLFGSFKLEDIDITDWFQYLIKEAAPERGSPSVKVHNIFEVLGDATGDIQIGQEIRVFGTTNDGIYRVTAAPTFNTGIGSPSLGTTDIPVATDFLVVNILEEGSPSTYSFVVTGNYTSLFSPHRRFEIVNAVGGSPTNNGTYTVGASSYNVTTNKTTITILETIPNVAVSGDTVRRTINTESGGFLEAHRFYGIRMVFEDTIGVSVGEAAVTAVLTTGGNIVGAWDYPRWDVGSYDENLGTVIHLYSNTF